MGENGIQELINFWKSFDLTPRSPCVHEQDRGAMALAKATVSEMSSASTFFELPKKDDFFHLSLSPVPYMGDLRSADIFLND